MCERELETERLLQAKQKQGAATASRCGENKTREKGEKERMGERGEEGNRWGKYKAVTATRCWWREWTRKSIEKRTEGLEHQRRVELTSAFPWYSFTFNRELLQHQWLHPALSSLLWLLLSVVLLVIISLYKPGHIQTTCVWACVCEHVSLQKLCRSRVTRQSDDSQPGRT